MNHTFKDETGKVLGMLTVLRRYGSSKRGVSWLCRCECGREIAVYGAALRNKTTRSCGCLREMSFEERKARGYWPLPGAEVANAKR